MFSLYSCMNNFLKLFFLLFSCGLSLASLAQTDELKEYKITGRTLSSENNEVVQLASIINLSNGKRAISNRQGYFKITFLPDDTIFISAIGYRSITVICRNINLQQLTDTITVVMKAIDITLKEVTIVSSNPKRDSIARAAAEFLKNDPLMNNYDRILNRQRGGLMSPLTAMYQQFSKEGRDAVQFEEFLAYAERQKQADRRYNRDFVKRVTKLDDKYLDEFMLFCRLDKEFIIASSEYELIQSTQKCAKEFKVKR